MSRITKEVLVGTVALSIVMVTGAVFSVVGEVKLSKGYPLYVDYEDSLGLEAGAEVRVAGMPVGEVEEVVHLGGVWDEQAEHHVFVRVVLEIDRDQRTSILESTRFVIAQEGFVGSPYIEAYTLDTDAPVAQDEFVFTGIEPRTFADIQAHAFDAMDQIIAIGERVTSAAERNPRPADQLINDTADQTLEALAYLDRRGPSIDEGLASFHADVQGGPERARELIAEWEDGTQEVIDLAHQLDRETRDLDDTLERAEAQTAELRRDLAPMLTDMSDFITDIHQELEANGGDIEAMLIDAESLTAEWTEVAADAQVSVAALRTMDTPLGRFLNDDVPWLDLQELIRDLRIRPWRIMWTQ